MVLLKPSSPQEDDHTTTTSPTSPFLKINKNIGSENGQLPLLFTAVLICSIFQLYVIPPVMGIYIPLYLIAVYALALRVNWLEAGKSAIGLILIGLYSIQTLSILWSPDKILGIRDLIFAFPFLIIYLYVQTNIKNNPQGIWRAVQIFCALAAVQSVLVIIFRVLPDLEISFFRSFPARIFINPNIITEFFSLGGGNNTFDSDKAGGFFVNANVAGVWGASILYITIAAFGVQSKSNNIGKIAYKTLLGSKSRFFQNKTKKSQEEKISYKLKYKYIPPIHGLSVVMCGSKASLGLLLITPVLSKIYLAFSKKHILLFFVIASAFACFILLFLYTGLANFVLSLEYFEDSKRTLLSRFFIWRHAAHEFIAHPILGQGYGGWSRSMIGISEKAFGLGIDIKDSFPPHNSFIYLWSQSGLLALIAGLALVAVSIKSFKQLHTIAPLTGFCFLTGYLFFIIQACGENYPIVGEFHQTAAIALITGIAAGLTQRKKEPLIKP